ncbi:hypothetical protein LAT59_02510 [Candidatus Gracilibacteria bacterium]|nr:hypothetical protein [Candidatus Gracilibacteria bacterium]
MRLKSLIGSGVVTLGLSGVAIADEGLGERFCTIERVDNETITHTSIEVQEAIVRCLGNYPIPGTESMKCELVEWQPGEFFILDTYTECKPSSSQVMS